VSRTGFEQFIDLHFDKTKPEDVQQRITKVYPLAMEALLFLNESSPRYYFTTLLKYATDDQPIRQVILELLLKSLQLDSTCNKIWRESYPTNIASSHNLVLYFDENFDRVHSEKRSGTLIQETLHSIQFFIDTNEKLLKGEFLPLKAKKPLKIKSLDVEEDDVKSCTDACRDLETKLKKVIPKREKSSSSSSGPSVGTIIFTFITILALLVGLFYTGTQTITGQHFLLKFGIDYKEVERSFQLFLDKILKK